MSLSAALMQFSNRYASLPPTFFAPARPIAVRDPKLLLWNSDLAAELQFPQAVVDKPTSLAARLAGNDLFPGSEPIAIAYAGHQFGHFVPQLGDGRAHLLGELLDGEGRIREVQLKGSGPTAFARGGDGRCALGPAIREFIMSEAMHALGIPTTRSLAVVTTGEQVYREQGGLRGGIVTRVASSHLRVGTFQFFAARGQDDAVRTLCDFAVDRHYPELRKAPDELYLRFLRQVIARQVALVTQWMRVGFIHGVMNTDNTSISGETIDYGPCAMMNVYDPATVFSSIDHRGRYAFGNQPSISVWNMARLAECLLPLIDDDEARGKQILEHTIAAMPGQLESAWLAMMGRKLGFSSFDEDHHALVRELLDTLTAHALDYTNTFTLLGESLTSDHAAAKCKASFGDWLEKWREALRAHNVATEDAQALMARTNPLVIPRNHDVESVLKACTKTLDPAAAEPFLRVLRTPYTQQPETSLFQDPPADGDGDYKTFCGT